MQKKAQTPKSLGSKRILISLKKQNAIGCICLAKKSGADTPDDLHHTVIF
ncbi:MAG: hypothetical protein ACW7DQ_16980 [Paraglaciecola chathamensis]